MKMKIHKLPDGILRAITVREPWASLHCMGIKNCEIRPWPWQEKAFPYPLTLAMHTSSDDSTLAEDIDTVVSEYDEAWYAFENPEVQPCVPGHDFFYSQAIVGLVDVIGCMQIDPKWSYEEKQDAIIEADKSSRHVPPCRSQLGFCQDSGWTAHGMCLLL
jgi:hypothetical protein